MKTVKCFMFYSVLHYVPMNYYWEKVSFPLKKTFDGFLYYSLINVHLCATHGDLLSQTICRQCVTETLTGLEKKYINFH